MSLLSVRHMGRAIIITAMPVEGSDDCKAPSVLFSFVESEFKNSTVEQCTDLIAERLKNALRTLEDHIVLTAKVK